MHRLLLLPCLAPLLVVVTIACLNLSKPLSLRVLTWRSSSLPLGVWMALGGSAGAAISFVAGISLSSRNVPLRHQVTRQANDPLSANPFTSPDFHFEDWNEQQVHQQSQPVNNTGRQSPFGPQAGPVRDIRDPSPTISVPFRVIKTGAKTSPINVKSKFPSDEKVQRSENVDHSAPVDSPANEAGDWGAGLSDEW